jgi:O-antigen ligase
LLVKKEYQRFSIGQNLAMVGIAMTLIGALFSRFVVSIGIFFFLVTFLVNLFNRQIIWSNARLRIIFPFVVLFGLELFQISRVDSQSEFFNQLLFKLPLLLVPFGLLNTDLDKDKSRWMFFVIACIYAVIAIGSTINYFLHAEEINELLLQSKHVPLLTEMHHIYFGIFLAIFALLCIHYFQNSPEAAWKKAWLSLAIILIFCLHVLSSRTGLIAFYASMAILFFQWIRSAASVKQKLIGAALLVLIPIIAVTSIPSLQNKILNTQEDIEALFEGGDELNFKSFSMRIEAWKATFEMITQAPILGVGNQNFSKHLNAAYFTIDSPLIPENRISPHNQFLETWGRLGVFGFLATLSIFLIAFFRIKGKTHPSFWAFWILFFMSFMVESVLERQYGMLMIGIFYFALFPLKKD